MQSTWKLIFFRNNSFVLFMYSAQTILSFGDMNSNFWYPSLIYLLTWVGLPLGQWFSKCGPWTTCGPHISQVVHGWQSSSVSKVMFNSPDTLNSPYWFNTSFNFIDDQLLVHIKCLLTKSWCHSKSIVSFTFRNAVLSLYLIFMCNLRCNFI